MRAIFFSTLVFVLLGSCFSCDRKKRTPEPDIIGKLTVDLDANETVIRKREALIGNLISDAIIADYKSKNKTVHFALLNSGSIRFSTSKRTDGIYKAGDFTVEMVDEMLPFGDIYVIVTVTGKQLKEILERSVAKFPLAKGNFMQLSKEIKIVVDTTQPAQVLNIDETSITTQGSRVISIKINDVEYESLSLYKIAMNEFTAEGNDGYTTLKKLSASLKENTGEGIANVLKEYVIINSVIEPKLEGRITFQ